MLPVGRSRAPVCYQESCNLSVLSLGTGRHGAAHTVAEWHTCRCLKAAWGWVTPVSSSEACVRVEGLHRDFTGCLGATLLGEIWPFDFWGWEWIGKAESMLCRASTVWTSENRLLTCFLTCGHDILLASRELPWPKLLGKTFSVAAWFVGGWTELFIHFPGLLCAICRG